VFIEIIPGGSLAFMCCKIKPIIDREQKKVVWLQAFSPSWDSAFESLCLRLFSVFDMGL